MKEERKTPWSKKGFIDYLDFMWRNPKKQLISEYRIKMLDYIIEEHILYDNDSYIIDCGCGTGILFDLLPDNLKDDYIGLDFTPEMIKHCQKKFRKHSTQFRIVDLLDENELIKIYSDYDYKRNVIVVTQNVIQHITLYQIAVDNIFKCICPTSILMCERTHEDFNRIVGYNPTRWRFNENDYYEMLKYFSKNMFIVEKLDRPKTTRNERDMLTIFRVRLKDE